MSTAIEWTDEVWNPVTGCTKVSQGCKNCYAERLFPRVYGKNLLINKTAALGTARDQMRTLEEARPREFTDVLTHADRLEQPLKWKRPRRIFVNSMSDLFHEDVPSDFIAAVFAVMHARTDHTFQILTKRAARMLAFSRWLDGVGGIGPFTRANPDVLRKWFGRLFPTIFNAAAVWHAGPADNVWLGVSVEDQDTFDERVEILGRVPAAVRFISYEPALGPIDCGNAFDGPVEGSPYGEIHWLIAGGESGPNARPAHPDWFRSVRDQCQAAGVSFFFKQWGEWTPDPELGRPYRALHMKAMPPALGSIEPLLGGRAFVAWERETSPGCFEGTQLVRVGKKKAGRELDGRTWDEFPEAR
ncbi:MAG TPA: phage Gp37/Gp68 family protein [Candidatus Binatia bacterium]|nr:phage Gp37/Gp68 family protein [Candidatus Binatia bacterium]